MKKDEPTPDELPKREIAKRVITPKRRYFVPEYGRSVEAESLDEAAKLAKKQAAKKAEDKEGDDATEQ